MSNHMNYKKDKTLKLFSTNAAGLKNGKVKSLKKEVINTKSNVITVQETHFSQKGRFQMQGMVIFEAIRKKKGGGTMLAIHEDFKPKLIEEYNEEFELLVVAKNQQIRLITGYGPQENLEEEKRMEFFVTLETEIERAELAGKSVIIEMDANSKLGAQYVKNDPHAMSPNGSILAEIIERHSLHVANGSEKCQGTITRKRITKQRIEQSVIDFVLYSHDLKEHFVAMHIDEARKHVLTMIRKTKRGFKVKESDHNVLVTEFNCKSDENEEKEKDEVYNLSNKECKKNFKEYTTNTRMLSSIFDDSADVDLNTARLLKKIKGSIAINFKKIRMNNKSNTKDDDLYDKMRELKNKEDAESIKELEIVKQNIADAEEENMTRLKEELEKVKPGSGGLNTQQMWKLRKRMCPKSRDPPSAMLDSNGNLITSDKAIENEAIKEYTKRLEPNKIEEHLEHLEKETNDLCEERLKACAEKKTSPWTSADLKVVLKQMEDGKSRDADGFPNEIFKDAGSDLLEAILKLMNQIKSQQKYPKLLQKCNITSIHKKKSKKLFHNYRGVFRVATLRSILDRLMYNDSYTTIDANLTDGNVGARKSRGCRDNMFVLSAVSNSVIRGQSKPIQAQIMDAETCFDKLWLQSCINALFEAGLDNDQLNLLYIENKEAEVAVKVNNKLTERKTIKDVIMQGTVWSSLKCTAVMDKLNKHMMTKPTL